MSGKKGSSEGSDILDTDFNFENDAPLPAGDDAFSFPELPVPAGEPLAPQSAAPVSEAFEDEDDNAGFGRDSGGEFGGVTDFGAIAQDEFGSGGFGGDPEDMPRRPRGRASEELSEDDAFGGIDADIDQTEVTAELTDEADVAGAGGQSFVRKYAFHGIAAVFLLGAAWWGYTSVLAPMLGPGDTFTPPTMVEEQPDFVASKDDAPRPSLPNSPGTVALPLDEEPATVSNVDGAQSDPEPTLPGLSLDVPETGTKEETQLPVVDTPTPAQADPQVEQRLASLEDQLSALSKEELVARLANIEGRLNELESQPQLAGTPRPLVEPPAKPAVLGDWELKGVQGDVAWVDGPGGFLEVKVGDGIPNVGTVDQVTRYEGDWVVVTSAGVILKK